jgi:hypothetical protein
MGMGEGGRARHGDSSAAALRAAALDRLREAESAASRDPERFERLVWSALDLLDRARTLSGDATGNPRPFPGKEE